MASGISRATFALATALTVTACGIVPGAEGCTAIGALSEVDFRFPSVTAGVSGLHRVEACVGATCKEYEVALTGEPAPTEPAPPAWDGERDGVVVLAPEMTGRPENVRLRIVRVDDSSVLFSGQTTVVPDKVQPNGSGCDPTVWQSAVVATPGGSLVHIPLEER